MNLVIDLEKFLRPEKKYLVFDIGNFGLKLGSLYFKNNIPVINDFKEYSIRKSKALTGKVKILKEYIKTKGLDAYEGILFLNDTGLIIRYIKIPNMPDEELENAIRFEAKKELPFDIKDAVIDFIKIGKDDENEKLNILLAVYKKNDLKSYYKFFNLIGIKLTAISIFPITIKSIFEMMELGYNDKVILHIDLGHKTTCLNILNKGKLAFSRVLSIGAYQIDEFIAENISPNPLSQIEFMGKARQKKEEIGLIGEDKEIVEMVEEGVNRIIQRIRLTIGYYKTQSGIKKIDRIVFSGGFANCKGISKYFESNFDMFVDTLDLSKINYLSFESKIPQIMESNILFNVFGMLYDAAKYDVSINILPKNKQPKYKFSLDSKEDLEYLYKIAIKFLEKLIPNPTFFFSIVYIVLFSITFIPYFYFKTSYTYYNKKNKKYSKLLQEINYKIIDANNKKSELEKLKELNKQKKFVYSGKKDWPNIFIVFSHLIPDTIVIDRLSFSLNKKREHVFSLTGRTIDSANATTLALEMAKNKLFREVNLEKTITNYDDKRKKNISFVITGKINKLKEKNR